MLFPMILLEIVLTVTSEIHSGIPSGINTGISSQTVPEIALGFSSEMPSWILLAIPKVVFHGHFSWILSKLLV